jgi:hypothetical protein
MSIQQQLSQTTGLLSAVDAVRNWRAAALLLGSLLAAGLLGSLAGVVSFQVHPALGAVFALLAAAVFFYGANAAGIMLMDEAQGSPSRPVLAAVLTALSIGHRFILVMLLVGLVYVVGLLAMALLLLLCKIPGLGPLLFAFVFPVCVVMSGLAIFAGYAVIAPLAGPAVWSGSTTMQALSRLAAIARQRIVVVVLSVLVLLLICGFVGSLILGVMFTGTLITGGMSAGIIGVNGMDLGSVMGMGNMSGYGGGRGGDGSSGHVAAGAFGWGVLMAVAFTLPLLVYLRGCCQLYLANIQGVDAEGIEQQLRDRLDAAKRSAAEIKAKGEAMAAQQAQRFEKAAASGAVPAPASDPGTPQAQCAVCSTPCLPGDAFCGGCGHKLTP